MIPFRVSFVYRTSERLLYDCKTIQQLGNVKSEKMDCPLSDNLQTTGKKQLNARKTFFWEFLE